MSDLDLTTCSNEQFDHFMASVERNLVELERTTSNLGAAINDLTQRLGVLSNSVERLVIISRSDTIGDPPVFEWRYSAQ